MVDERVVGERVDTGGGGGPAGQLLALAGGGLRAAAAEPAAGPRFGGAHLAALRAAAAVLASRAGPDATGSGRPRSAWVVLARVAPELAEWAQFFAASTPRGSVPARGVSARDADDMVRQVEQFLVLAERAAVRATPTRR